MSALRIALGASLAAAGAAHAHHSPAPYDMASEVVIEGTIAELTWKNPHVYIALDVVGADGQSFLQDVEVVPLPSAQAFGLTPEILAPGSEVAVRARPNRRGSGVVLGLDVTTSAGAVYALHSTGRSSGVPATTERAQSIEGKWAPSAATYAAFTRTVQTQWPFNDAARAGLADAQDAVAYALSCEVYPPPMMTGTPALRTIEIGEDAVVITLDAAGSSVVSTVHLDQTEHPADIEPSLYGHAIGRWEGETLVIDTAGFAPNPLGLGFGFPSSAAKRLVERLTLAEDGLGVRYELTAEDPEYLSEPATFSGVWEPRPDLELSNAPCDLEVSSRFLEE